MHCLTDGISSFHWFVLLAVGMAGDETINPVKLLTKPNRATSQKKKPHLLCLHAQSYSLSATKHLTMSCRIHYK